MTNLSTVFPPPGRTALFLDFDGTLVDIADHPTRVVVPPDLPALVAELARVLDGALAVVSGRRVEEIDGFLGHPPVTVVGEHGLDRRSPDGTRTVLEPPAGLADARAALEAAAAGIDGAWVENKRGSVAIHYRAAPQAEPAIRAAAAHAAAACEPPLHLLAGKMVVELRRADTDKGTAIAMLLGTPAFQGRVPVFAGDDVTDEDGFAVVEAAGGVTVLVGDRQTRARHRVSSAAALRQALHAWIEAAPRGVSGTEDT